MWFLLLFLVSQSPLSLNGWVLGAPRQTLLRAMIIAFSLRELRVLMVYLYVSAPQMAQSNFQFLEVVLFIRLGLLLWGLGHSLPLWLLVHRRARFSLCIQMVY